MSVERCIGEIERALGGRQLRQEELDELEREVSGIIRRLRETDVDDIDAGLEQALTERGNEIETLAWIEKRNSLLNMRARARVEQFVVEQFPDDMGLGLRAALGGIAGTQQGSRNSVAWAQESLANYYIGGFLTELESGNLLKPFRSGAYDKEIYRARYLKARGDEAGLQRLSPEARQIAEIIERYNEKTRLDANDSGAWIGQLEDFTARQVHDAYKIRQVSQQDWIAFVEQRLDWQRSFPDVEDAAARRQILERAYNDFASGVHMAQPKDGPSTNLKGFANIGRRMSQERVFHFRDGDAAAEYAAEFGHGRLIDTLMNQYDTMAQNTALMRMLGPNAENNFSLIADRLRQRMRDADAATREQFENRVDRGPLSLTRTLLPNLTGESRRPGHHGFAKWSLGVRQIQQLGKLGGAVVSAVTDVPFYASTVAYNKGGNSFFSGLGEAFGGIARGTSSEQRRILAQLGVVADGMKGAAMSRYDISDGVPGAMTRLTNLFFKANFLQPWTDRLRSSFAMARAHDHYMQRASGWDGLPAEQQRALGLYDIDAGKWDLYRQQQGMSDGEWTFFTAEGMDDVSDEAVAGYLRSQNRSASQRSIREAREQIKQNFRSYFADQASFAALAPDKRTRAALLQGTQPGTVSGELARHVALFKSFPTTVMMKPLAREIYGRGNLRGEGASLNDSPVFNLAQLILWNTAFGYLAMNAKEALRGREPRVPETPGEFGTVFAASMVQGGGLGIYGDFLFGEVKSRFGGTFTSTLLGPTAGTVDDIANIYGKMTSGEDPSSEAFRFLVNNTPGNNLFYTRMALDYALLYRVQEWLDPGSLRRMEDRMEDEMGNEYFLRPSDHVPRGGF